MYGAGWSADDGEGTGGCRWSEGCHGNEQMKCCMHGSTFIYLFIFILLIYFYLFVYFDNGAYIYAPWRALEQNMYLFSFYLNFQVQYKGIC